MVVAGVIYWALSFRSVPKEVAGGGAAATSGAAKVAS
jgi:hypothetical protein